jgi:Cu2+-containing amine oxidase
MSIYKTILLHLCLLGLLILPGVGNSAITETPSFKWPDGRTVSWSIQFDELPAFGLVVREVHFNNGTGSGLFRIAGEFRTAEIFVPYYGAGGGSRVYDVRDNNYSLRALTSLECPGGVLLLNGKICKEQGDRGIAWLNEAGSIPQGSRGQEVRYTAIYAAGNYSYIFRYSFRDDGSIGLNIGSTGAKKGIVGTVDYTRGHMHNFIMRLDLDIGGYNNNVFTMSHTEIGNTGTDTWTQVLNETGVAFSAGAFTRLRACNSTLTNSNGRPVCYDMMLPRFGIARHPEAFMRNDFWVTKWHPNIELYAVAPGGANLAQYVNNESIAPGDVVVWPILNVHHEQDMRDEDGCANCAGSTPTIWTGLELRPYNFFPNTPLY